MGYIMDKLSDKTKERLEIAKELYNKGLSREQIAAQMKMSYSGASKYVDFLVQNGMVQKRPPARKSHGYTFKRKAFDVSQITEGEPVRCTVAVSKRCVYGVENATYYTPLCRFSAITGKCRSVGEGGCPHNACTRFVKIDKEHKRLDASREEKI